LATSVDSGHHLAADSDVIRWTGKDVTAVSVALRLLDLRQAASDEEGYPLARASVMNLLVYASEPSQIDVAIATVDELALRHPSRAIVVASRPGDTFTLDAEVAIHQHPLATHGLVYERAILRPAGADPEGLDTLVIPLLIPHLQSFLWWLAKPNPHDPALQSLAGICDRLIIDSSMGSASELHDISERLVKPGGGEPVTPGFGRLVMGDMTWTRLDAFRGALARIFDEGDRAEFLDGLQSIAITGCRPLTHPVSPAEVLFAGWLASRLRCTTPSWVPDGVSMRLEGSGPGHRVIFSFGGVRGYRSPRPSEVHYPIDGIRLIAKHGRRSLDLELRCQGDGGRLTIKESGRGPVRRGVPMSQPDETEVLSRELARLGRDRVYEEAMASAALIQTALTS
jgi:glucose-6-phosphate dehydrogenase assembly protein OpcA